LPGFEPSSRVETSAHRIGALRPVFVQDEFAETRMALERQLEEILGLALMPID
jgi:hypothetical protein